MSYQFTQRLKYHEIRIRRDGKGGWRDKVLVERIWKSVKYEKVSLKAYDSISTAKANLGAYLNFLNTRRSHPWLDGKTSDTINYAGLPQERIAVECTGYPQGGGPVDNPTPQGCTYRHQFSVQRISTSSVICLLTDVTQPP